MLSLEDNKAYTHGGAFPKELTWERNYADSQYELLSDGNYTHEEAATFVIGSAWAYSFEQSTFKLLDSIHAKTTKYAMHPLISLVEAKQRLASGQHIVQVVMDTFSLEALVVFGF